MSAVRLGAHSHATARLVRERDRAHYEWLRIERRVREVQNVGPVDILPLLEGQARFLWAEYESAAAKAGRAIMMERAL